MPRAIPRRIRSLCLFAGVALVGLLSVGCDQFPESIFSLASESRLPKWFHLPPGQTRATVAVKMAYFIDSSGSTAVFTLLDSNGVAISKVTGKSRGHEPLQLRKRTPGFPEGYPAYEVIMVGEITEIIEHRRMEPVFYVTDDPAVWAELAGHG